MLSSGSVCRSVCLSGERRDGEAGADEGGDEMRKSRWTMGNDGASMFPPTPGSGGSDWGPSHPPVSIQIYRNILLRFYLSFVAQETARSPLA